MLPGGPSNQGQVQANRLPSVSSARECTENALARLDQILNQLETRLASVLRDAVPTPCAPTQSVAADPDACELSNWIKQTAGVVARFAERVEYLTSRLEV